MAYKWIKTGEFLQRLTDGALIPCVADNRDYAEFLASGEVPAAQDPPLTSDQKASGAADAIDRLQFDIAFNIENRVRVLEGKVAISRPVYRDALIARWKVLNP